MTLSNSLPLPAPVLPVDAAQAKDWHWPLLDPAQYNRTPELTPSEHAALVALGWELRRARCYDPQRPEWKAIERLLRPLDDARLKLFTPTTRAHRRCSHDAVALILHGCATTNTAFWGWGPHQWVKVFGPNQQSLQQEFSGWVDGTVRPYMMGIAYLLDCFSSFELLGSFNRIALATRVFGPTLVQQAVDQVMAILRGWGYHSARNREKFPCLVASLLLLNHSPYLADVTTNVIENLRHHEIGRPTMTRSAFFGVQRALAALGLVDPPVRYTESQAPPVEGVDPCWQEWVGRWAATSTLTPTVRSTFRNILLKVGRWLAAEHAEVREPAQWNRELCASYLALVERMRVGDFTQRRSPLGERLGQPLSARTKAGYIEVVRTFFYDCQEWEWIARRFDPARAFATPPSIRALIGPNPRVIADEIWAKLVWAGLNLEANDLPSNVGGQFYPLELLRALSIVWLFGGLRSDEISRLRVGCIRWQSAQVNVAETNEQTVAKEAVCLLDIPTNKTGTAFTKPVDPLVGRAIGEWEAVRPQQPTFVDRRTGERVQMLFCYRAIPVAKEYLNGGLIPALCRKGGVPPEDVRGRITSHRARATIASQLYNAKEPMTLFELQAWLGHQSAETTQHYARISPTTLTKAYTDAGYFSRNVRTIEVLLDREAVASGAVGDGTPWQYYDLGHGYCTYNFFEQCPHRMACARCDFYLPKSSSKSQILEARGNLQQMLAKIPLTEEERAAVEDGAEALKRLLTRLEDVPTPSGRSPRQLSGKPLPLIQIKRGSLNEKEEASR